MRDLYDLSAPTGISGEIGLLTAMLQEGTLEWRGELPKRVSRDALRWRPFEGGHSMGAIFMHMADVEGWWIHEVAAGISFDAERFAKWRWEEVDQYKVSWPDPPNWTLGRYFDIQDAIRRESIAILRNLDPTAEVSVKNSKRKFTVRWILNHVIGHEAYHAGQAVLLWLAWKNASRAR